jgi:3-oxoacyl-[acyl-carrier-protein] synthase-3
LSIQRTQNGVRIAGTGSYLPELVVTNDDLRKRGLETDDEWIRSRTGIRERRFARPDQAASDLGIEAAKLALAAAEIAPSELDLIVCSTMTGDYVIPSTAALLQRGLNATNAGGFDLGGACSGFVLGLLTCSQWVKTGMARKVLLVGTEKMTHCIDPTKRDTAVIFADGAGAAVLVSDPSGASELITMRTGLRGDTDFLVIPAGGSRQAITPDVLEKRLQYVHMKGRQTYRFAVTTFVDLIEKTCADAGISVNDLALVVPHQLNMRILEAAAEKAGVPKEKIVLNVDRVGNTSAASCGIALDEAVRAGRIRRGDLVLMVAFGAGLSWASALLRW